MLGICLGHPSAAFILDGPKFFQVEKSIGLISLSVEAVMRNGGLQGIH
jgi:hypothetical protein